MSDTSSDSNSDTWWVYNGSWSKSTEDNVPDWLESIWNSLPKDLS